MICLKDEHSQQTTYMKIYNVINFLDNWHHIQWVSTKSRYDPDLGYINIWFGSFLGHHQKSVHQYLIQMTPIDYPLELNKQSNLSLI